MNTHVIYQYYNKMRIRMTFLFFGSSLCLFRFFNFCFRYYLILYFYYKYECVTVHMWILHLYHNCILSYSSVDHIDIAKGSRAYVLVFLLT